MTVHLYIQSFSLATMVLLLYTQGDFMRDYMTFMQFMEHLHGVSFTAVGGGSKGLLKQ